MKSLIMLLLLFFTPTIHSAGFNVISGPLPKGETKPDSDRLSPKREQQLLTDAVAYGKSKLPEIIHHLERQGKKDLAQQVQGLSGQLDRMTFVINHDFPMGTKNFLGWSSEDDPDYRFPDTKYYPQGSIKINSSEMLLQLLDLSARLMNGELANGRYAVGSFVGDTRSGEEKEKARFAAQGIRDRLVQHLLHESLHAWQYHTKPVLDYNRYWQYRCREEGVDCDDPKTRQGIIRTMFDGDGTGPGRVTIEGQEVDLLEHTQQKIQYERDAFAFQRNFGDPDAMLAAAEILEEFEKAHPELFQKGARYALLSSKRKKAVFDHYVRGEAKNFRFGGRLNGTKKIYYEGQYAPFEIVQTLKRVNTSLASETNSRKILALQQEGRAAVKKWGEYMNDPYSPKLLKVYPYLNDVSAMYARLSERFETLTESNG